MTNISNLLKIFFLGASFILMLVIFQLSHPASVSAQTQVCSPNQWDVNQCARCAADGSRMGAFGSDYGDLSNKAAWCSCAARNNDTGSLMRESCPQAPRNVTTGTTAVSCDDLGKDFGFCPGVRTYDQCTLRFEGNQAFFDCKASQNSNCIGTIRCQAKDKVAAQPAPAAAAVVNCPAGTTVGQNSQGVTVCVANANVNANANTNIAQAQGGAGGSANVSITGAAPAQPAALLAAAPAVKQLPATGLPEIALASLGLIPLGTGLKGFRRGLKTLRSNDPSFIWEDRQFKGQS
ncbi:MAG: hypothetical protein HYW45_02660 [Candidatus Daviesbacteria bacterium]|nr:MAG: hypothetical protein HYW45_02660 [Candidatus Daviesbacteria bacterium]